jgi:hypothetical protein
LGKPYSLNKCSYTLSAVSSRVLCSPSQHSKNLE